MPMKRRLVIAVLAMLAIPLSARTQSNDAIVGTWKLVSATDTTDKGAVRDAFGKNPAGLLTYTADGRMMVIITHAGRKSLSVDDYISAPPEERAEAFATVLAYSGRYTRRSGEVIHHIEICSIQNRVNRDMVRTIVALEDNRLILRTPQRLHGTMATTELIWERIN